MTAIANVIEQCQVRLELECMSVARRLRIARSQEEARVINHLEQRRLRDRLDRVVQAKQRIAAGCFGICPRCRNPIEHELLLAQPTTQFCPHCQRRLAQVVIGRQDAYRLVSVA